MGYINICARTQVVKHGPATFMIDTPKKQYMFQCDHQQVSAFPAMLAVYLHAKITADRSLTPSLTHSQTETNTVRKLSVGTRTMT